MHPAGRRLLCWIALLDGHLCADAESDAEQPPSDTRTGLSDSKTAVSERSTRPFRSPLLTDGGKMIMTGKTFQVCLAALDAECSSS